jgi:hypothetical protein
MGRAILNSADIVRVGLTAGRLGRTPKLSGLVAFKRNYHRHGPLRLEWMNHGERLGMRPLQRLR